MAECSGTLKRWLLPSGPAIHFVYLKKLDDILVVGPRKGATAAIKVMACSGTYGPARQGASAPRPYRQPISQARYDYRVTTGQADLDYVRQRTYVAIRNPLHSLHRS
jgi:hypothetical protein